jgi:deoxyribonuclease-4
MSAEIAGVQPCLDFAHLHARAGDGTMNTFDEWRRSLELYGKQLGKKALKNLSAHLSGIDYGDKGEKEHLPIEESDLDLDAILKALAEFGCEGRILIESPVMEEDALLVQRRWAELSGEDYGG